MYRNSTFPSLFQLLIRRFVTSHHRYCCCWLALVVTTVVHAPLPLLMVSVVMVAVAVLDCLRMNTCRCCARISHQPFQQECLFCQHLLSIFCAGSCRRPVGQVSAGAARWLVQQAPKHVEPQTLYTKQRTA